MSVSNSREDAYVALFDILGFSKIVERNELDRIADTYSRAKAVFEEILSHINAVNKGFTDIEIEYRSFSDTFLIYTSRTGDEAFLSMLAACDGLFIGGIENKLLLRGAVTRGEIITKAGMEIGRPIVDAYRNEQIQEWSGCWVSDECLADFDATNNFADKSLVLYEIPLKNGEVKNYVAFNWVKSLAWKAMYENKKNDFELKQIEDMINFMNEQQADWAVRRKQYNTIKFVEYVTSPEFIMAYKKR
jgi:hypothetical protein